MQQIDLSHAEKTLQACAAQLAEATGHSYTHVELSVQATAAGMKVYWRSYQNGTNWTDEHPSWDSCVAEATSAKFHLASLLKDAEKAEAEARRLRAEAAKLQ